ncbi:hypothetical protein PVAND_016104 [Polypedilum vanderplanki]|uniref:C-type lectin domain-containing protein n=1 Tax=Polypedilum vanderplanki TaxID=319348 RepID=A0A9J6BEV4_POLVA|nr:hypothetical protein PVAND_016104 [Polypedilum vanderplanki]
MKVLVTFLILCLIHKFQCETSETNNELQLAIKATQNLIDIIAKNPEADKDKILSLNKLLNVARSISNGENSKGFRADQLAVCDALKQQIENLNKELANSQVLVHVFKLQMQGAQVFTSALATLTGPSINKLQATYKKIQAMAKTAVKLAESQAAAAEFNKQLKEAKKELEDLQCDSIENVTEIEISTNEEGVNESQSASDETLKSDNEFLLAIKSTQELIDVIAENPKADLDQIKILNELLDVARSLALEDTNFIPSDFRASQSAACTALRRQISTLKAELLNIRSKINSLTFQLQSAQLLVSVLTTLSGPNINRFSSTFRRAQILAQTAKRLTQSTVAEAETLKALLEATKALEKLRCNSPLVKTTEIKTMDSSQRLSLTDCKSTYDLYNNRGIYLKSMCWIDQALDYEGAEDFCRAKGMHLFAITKADENEALRVASDEHIDAIDVWINGKQSEDGSWWVYAPDKKKLLEYIWPTKVYSRWNAFLHYGNYEGSFTTIGGFKQANKTFICEFGKSDEESESTTEELPSFELTNYEDNTTTTTPSPSSQRCPGCFPIINFCALPSSSECTCVAGKMKVQCPIIGPFCCK